MGKPTKYSNIYTKDGKLLRHVSDRGIIENWTIEETEELVDKLGKDVDENGKLNHPVEFNNAMKWLQHLYATQGNPHEKELIEKLQEMAKINNTNDAVGRALGELNEQLNIPSEGDENSVSEGEPATSVAQSDLLVEREEEPTIMEEIID